MTNNDSIKALKCCVELFYDNNVWCDQTIEGLADDVKYIFDDLINRQQAEIENLKDENKKAVRRFADELYSKFSGHSDYHGDTILTKIICLKEGKEIKVAEPIDRDKIKAEAVKEYIEKVKEHYKETRFAYDADNLCKELDDILKERIGEKNEKVI